MSKIIIGKNRSICIAKSYVTDMAKYLSTDDKSTNSNLKEDDDKNKRPIYAPENPASIDDPPTTCCMSGCHNCVYIAWAEALSKQMSSVDPVIAKKILENVDDPGMKAFLQMELRTLKII